MRAAHFSCTVLERNTGSDSCQDADALPELLMPARSGFLVLLFQHGRSPATSLRPFLAEDVCTHQPQPFRKGRVCRATLSNLNCRDACNLSSHGTAPSFASAMMSRNSSPLASGKLQVVGVVRQDLHQQRRHAGVSKLRHLHGTVPEQQAKARCWF